MHLPLAILSPTPPKRLQIARMGDISPRYRTAPPFLLSRWQKIQMLKKKEKKKKTGGLKCKARELICRRSCDACWASEWRGEAGRMVSVQGAFPHSTACQSRYLSASNRGTGEDRQHLLSKPNYLLSTKQGGEPAPQPAMSSHIHMHKHSYSSRFDQYKSLKRGPVVIYLFICWIMAVLGSELWLIWKCCWIKDNTLSAGVVPCSALTVSWQRGAQNHHKSIYGTLNQISSGGDSTFHHVALSRNKGLPATIKQVSERRYES